MEKKLRKDEKSAKNLALLYICFVVFDCGGGGIGRIVAFERFSCSFRISEMALPSGTIILVLRVKAGPEGFEPSISGSEGRHLNPC